MNTHRVITEAEYLGIHIVATGHMIPPISGVKVCHPSGPNKEGEYVHCYGHIGEDGICESCGMKVVY